MKILYLYTEAMGYTLATIRALLARGGDELHLVHWDRGRLTPFQAVPFAGLHLHARSTLRGGALAAFVEKLAPDLAVVSGWQDRGYLAVARQLRRRGVPVVVGFDDQWKGTMRQRIAACFNSVLKTFFSHAWVTGPLQYDYARRLGFSAQRIVHDLYSADVELFAAKGKIVSARRSSRIIFVGRLERVKGVDLLLATWENLRAELPDWELVMVGNGSLESSVAAAANVRRQEFLSAPEVAEELAAASAFVLPSRHEPWGVVVHEAVAAGLPVLCSNVVGAAATFVIDGYNGYLFRPDDAADLARAIRNFAGQTEDERRLMGERSRELSRRITPKTSAANLMSVVPKRPGSQGQTGRPVSGATREIHSWA